MIGTIFTILGLASLAVVLWALIDAAVRPRPAFEAAGQNKILWILLPIGGLLLMGVVGGIVGLIYLTVIRPKVQSAQRY
ncbi:MAG TPA: DUF2516 family protein [Acidimicrobiales bacterium]|nr:DUF2516 family protein [Acidimicrobiales bacterium]